MASTLSENINEVGALLVQLLHSGQTEDIRTLLRESVQDITCFDNPHNYDYVDLGHLYSNMLMHIEKNQLAGNEIERLLQLLTDGKNLIAQAVVANVTGTNHAHAKGISIYFPLKSIHASYKELAWTQHYPHWGLLLDAIR